MTDKLAKEVFDTLLEQIGENGLEDIVTFSLPEPTEDSRFSKFTSEYSYISTKTQLQTLVAMSENIDRGALRALQVLTSAMDEYFSIAKAIPDKYKNSVDKLFAETGLNVSDEILMENANQGIISLTKALENENIDKILSLVRFINKNFETSDEIFMRQLDNL